MNQEALAPGPAGGASLSVRELASELSVSPKTMRAWMRRQGWRSAVEHGQTWVISPEHAALLRDHFSDGEALAAELAVVDGDPNPGSTVGELLAAYRGILASLRARGMVRTNNAPIGDLAEYSAAVVYDGLLAPNSEKSYDLVAEDGRRIQVKVRVMRPGTRKSSVFSAIRSFGFDACLFLLIDDDADDVLVARELTVEQVQALGSHRAHTNGTVLRVGQLSTSTVGLDLTGEFRAVWRELLASRS